MTVLARVKKLEREARQTIRPKLTIYMKDFENPGHFIGTSGDGRVSYTEAEFIEHKKIRKELGEVWIDMIPYSKKGVKPWD